MAESPGSIFNKRAADRLRNPDDLDKYVRVTSPSVWAVVGAMACLLAGLLAWGIFGAVSTSVAATGTCVERRVMCFLTADDVARVDVGDEAIVDGHPATVSYVAPVPLSRGEANAELMSDYLENTLVKADWTYQVEFDVQDKSSLDESIPLTVNITTERVAPITLLIG